MPPIVSPREWEAAREKLLVKEKELTRADLDVDEWHGTNACLRDDEDRVFRTYFVNNRGDEVQPRRRREPGQ